MGLLAWYPLNGNINSQGILGPIDVVNTSNYEYVDGKIGKGLSTGSIYWDGKTAEKILKRSQLTICMWVKTTITDPGTTSSTGNLLFGNEHMSNVNYGGRVFSMFRFPTLNDFHWSWQIDSNIESGGGVVTSGIIRNIFPENKWTHIAIVYDNPNAYLYVDGEYYQQLCNNYDINKCTIPFTHNMCMITSKENRVLNDYRFYDKALSAAEVKEIAKGLMLHYSFENPYSEPTVNIPHSLINTAYVSLGNDSNGNYFTKNSGGQGWNGLSLNYVNVTGGNYYTWSMEVNPTVDLYEENQIEVAEGNVDVDLPIGSHFYFDRNLQPTSTWEGNDKGAIITSTFQGNLPKNTWTKVWITVYVVPEVGSTRLFHYFCPQIPTGASSLKVYYRNSMVEKKNHMTPYTSSSREAGLIRDNSGMGNDGTQIYQREEIPITGNTTINSLVWTAKNPGQPQYEPYQNQRLYIGHMSYNSKYFYLNSVISYEFDIKLENTTIVDGKPFYIWLQGETVFNDGTSKWLDGSAVHTVYFPNRLKKGANGSYHITIEKVITNLESITNVNKYYIELRVDYINSGTITVSNFKCYYQSLDTSTLSLSDNRAIGTHSAYFNGKNFIDAGVVTPDYMDELTLSCWVYKEDWTKPIVASQYSRIAGCVDWGGFGIGIDRDCYTLLNEVCNDTVGNGASYIRCDNKFDLRTFSQGWHQIAMVCNKNTAITYIDGKEYYTNNHNSNLPIRVLSSYKSSSGEYITLPFLVGTEIDGVNLSSPVYTKISDMYVDDVRLYSTALSEEDIKALYNVKAKIDNKSNLYCNQLVEIKSENMAHLESVTSAGCHRGSAAPTVTYKDGILTIKANGDGTNVSTNGYYLYNACYGGSLVTNKTYRYSIYVKFSRSGRWKVGEERIINSSSSPFKNGQEYEAGKWYKIENEGVATAAQVNFIFYSENQIIKAGDKIQIRDFQMYRLYDENYNPGPNVKGQYKTFEIDETGLDEYISYNTINKYDAIWLPVFHHDTNGNTVWFTNEAEALHCDTKYKYSILDQLEGFRGSDGKFEFLLEYPQDLPNQYNRWKQIDNPTTTQELSGSTSSPANGYEAVHIDWTSNSWGGLLKSNIDPSNNKICTFIDGTTNHNHWFYAIGCYDNNNLTTSVWNNKMPGPSGSTGMKEVNLYVRVDSKYMGATIVDKYGAEWLEVFYHNTNNDTVYFANEQEALHTNSQYKFSILDQLENFRGTDNKFEFLLEYPDDLPNQYNRWKQTDNPVEIEETIVNNTYYKAGGYEEIHIDWNTNGSSDAYEFSGLLKSSTSGADTFIDGSIGSGTWFYSIGSLISWNGGIPGPKSGTSMKEVHLYVRIDNLENKNEIFRQYKRQTKTKEIIEI